MPFVEPGSEGGVDLTWRGRDGPVGEKERLHVEISLRFRAEPLYDGSKFLFFNSLFYPKVHLTELAA
jgi:hypothetical protein